MDLDDVSSYPPSVYQEYLEKKKYDNYIERKDEKIDKVVDQFHEFLEKRAADTIQKREKKGLKIRKRKSPIETITDFSELQEKQIV